MSAENSTAFRFWRPGINFRAKFETPSEIGELEDLLKEIQLGQQQQHALRSSPSWQSGSINSKESSIPHGLRVPEIIRRNSHRLRQSWQSSDEPSSCQPPHHISSLESLAHAPEPSTVRNSGTATTTISDADTPQAEYVGVQCQPRPATKLVRSPARRETREQTKEARRKKKQDEKTRKQREDARRNELRRRITEARESIRLKQNLNDNINRTRTDVMPSLRRQRSLNAWKRPLLMLSPHLRRNKGTIPMPSDFSSKAELQAYLNPVEDDTPIPQIPELPADPPPYNTPDAEASKLIDVASKSPLELQNAYPRPDVLSKELLPMHTKPEARRMKCDGCNSPIRVSEKYFHCLVCNGGDRIMCVACSYKGDLCRHELLWRTNSVKGASDCEEGTTVIPRQSEGCSKPSSCEPSKNSVTNNSQRIKLTVERTGESEFGHAKATIDGFEAFQQAEGIYRYNQSHSRADTTRYIDELHRRHNHVRKLERNLKQRNEEARQREQTVSLREKEAHLRDLEASIREQQAALREREAALFERTLLQRMSDLPQSSVNAVSKDRLHTDFTLPEHRVTQRSSVRAAPYHSDSGAPGEFLEAVTTCDSSGDAAADESSGDSHNYLREHAGTKRKAGANGSERASISKSKSPQSYGKEVSQGSPNNDEGSGSGDDEGEESDDDNHSKRRKQTGPVVLPQRLLACPYSKYDATRYSERNQLEKQYRGCAGRYLTDISRLKQHLYRVHRRPEQHCARCYEVFQRKDELDHHSRQAESCAVSECSFVEKFTEDKMRELKRKRPGKSAEQSWYIIFGILFPDQVPPDSPYIDDQPMQSGSAAVATGPPDARTSDLLEIFNEQLSQRQNIANHAWLASQEARNLINQTLAQSMAEMLRRMSPINTPSARTPSIFISPNSTSAQLGSTIQTPASSIPASPSSPKRPFLRSTGTIQELSPLQALQVDLNKQLRHGHVGKRAEVCQAEDEGSSQLLRDSCQLQPAIYERDATSIPHGLKVPSLEDIRDDPDYGMKFDHGLDNDNPLGDFDFDLPQLDDHSIAEHPRLYHASLDLSSRKDIGMATYVNDEDLDYVQSSMMAGAAAANTTVDEKMNGNSKRSVDSGYASKPTSRQNSQRDKILYNDSPVGHDVVTNIGLAFGGDQHSTSNGTAIRYGLGLGFLDDDMVHTGGKMMSERGVVEDDASHVNGYWWDGAGYTPEHGTARIYRGGVGGRLA